MFVSEGGPSVQTVTRSWLCAYFAFQVALIARFDNATKLQAFSVQPLPQVRNQCNGLLGKKLPQGEGRAATDLLHPGRLGVLRAVLS